MTTNPIVRAVPNIVRYKPKNHFDVRKHLGDFETLEDANKQHQFLLKAVKRYRSNDLELASALEGCRPGFPCRLLACPRCMRRLRIWLCDQVAPLIAVAPSQWHFVTIVFSQFQYERNSLHRFDPQKLIEKFRSVARRVGIEKMIAFGSLDFSEDARIIDRANRTYVWSAHTHHLIYGDDETMKDLKKEMRYSFLAARFVRRPVKFAPHRSKDFTIFQAISYCCKSTYNGKNIYYSSTDKPKRTAKRNKLRGESQAELAAFLARLHLRDRLLLIGLKHNQQKVIRTRSTPQITRAIHNHMNERSGIKGDWDDCSFLFR